MTGGGICGRVPPLFCSSSAQYNLIGMSEINRSLMVVRPKQPFLDWVRSVDDAPEKLELKDLQDNSSAYLVPEFGTFDEQMAIILWCWDVVFEEELFSWFTDEDLWPIERTPEMFVEWFDIEFHSLVFDLVDDLALEGIEDDTVPDSTPSNGDPPSNIH